MIECDAGVHHVSDVYCVCCGGYMGWQYVDAEDADQRYKIGEEPKPLIIYWMLRCLSTLLSFIRILGKSVLEMATLEKITREPNAQNAEQEL